MLNIFVAESELYDEEHQIFIYTHPIELHLEHSLVSISKWETKWKKPFLDNSKPKTTEESLDYIRCMTINQNVDPMVYSALSKSDMKKIDEYINTSMTATWFNDRNPKTPTREVITSELIYYQMIAFGIPFECQKWHLSRLLTLIRICSIKNSTENNMSQSEIYKANRQLNQARRKAAHSKG